MQRQILFISLFLTIFLYKTIDAQDEGPCFSIGYSADQFKHDNPYKIIVNDFNNYKTLCNATVESKLEVPDLLKGLVLGIKTNKKFTSFGVDLHFHRYSNTAKGSDTLGNSYYKKIKVAHDGFGVFLTLNLIHSKYFRMGPGFEINIEQFYNKTKNINDIHYSPILSTDMFLMSSTFQFPISFGGPKFNFDIIPYYFVLQFLQNVFIVNY